MDAVEIPTISVPARHRGLGKQVAEAASRIATGRRQTRRIAQKRLLDEAFCVFIREVLRRGRQETTGCSASRRVTAAKFHGQFDQELTQGR